MKICFILLAGFVLSFGAAFAAAPVEVKIAEEGKALLPVIVSPGATEGTKSTASTLAGMLERISGAKFEVIAGDGAKGLAIGRASDFPALQLGGGFAPTDPARREEYLLRSHAAGAWLVGATDLAVQHAAWDFLHRLGYRQFFPGKTWEILPKRDRLSIAVEATERPAYHSRRIWYGFGPLAENKEAYDDWCAKNRAVAGIDLHTGHAYDGILSRQKAAFAVHPEYLALVGGERKPAKFCISNPGLRRLVVEDTLAQLAREPQRDSISMDPSDGGGWCECSPCQALGSVSDRALLLANEAAAAVHEKFPGKLVGMYAYNEHSPPPAIAGRPNVVISVATGFIRGGFTVDQLLDGWRKQVRTLGIREYYSVNTWDRDAPGAARGGDLAYLRRTIPHFHAQGARFLSAESSDNWGPNGLGYYLASRMLWDVREAQNLEPLVADFLEKAFGAARGPMGKFYQLLDGAKRQALTDDLLGRMFRLLDEARQAAADPAIRARLDDLVHYTRYCELYLDYSSATGAARQAFFEQLLRHAWRIRTTGMVHAKALYRDLPSRDKAVAVPAAARWDAPVAANPWKQDPPLTAKDAERFVREGIANRKLLDFTPLSFTDKLVPATGLDLPKVTPGNPGLYLRGVNHYYTWIGEKPGKVKLRLKAGIIYNSRGPAIIELFPVAEPEGKSVARIEVPPDKVERAIELNSTFTGLHRIEVSDGTAGTSLAWDAGVPMTVISSPESPAKLHGRWTLYFHVPRGTKVIGGFSSGEGLLLDPAGKTAHEFEARPGYFKVPVPSGSDGQLWKFAHTSGQRLLMTVPPCLARDGRELLLPAEVLEGSR